MTEGGPPALQPPPVVPDTPASPVQPPAQPAQPDQLIPLVQPGQQVHVMLNWSHFRSEFSGRPEEDAEAHLLKQMIRWKHLISRHSKNARILLNPNSRSKVVV